MHTLLLYTTLFLFAGSVVLCSDALGRKEYGTRPKILLVSLFLFLIAGVVLSFLASWLGDNEKYYTVILSMGCVLVFQAAFLLMEYSIHVQRIQKGFLMKEVTRQAIPFFIAYAALVLIFIICVMTFHASAGASILQMSAGLNLDENLYIIANDKIGLFYVLFIIILCYSTIQINSIFGVQRGVIRQNKIIYIILFLLQILLLFAATFLKRPMGKYSHLIFLPFEILFAVRVFQEYFFYRMHHLNDLHAKLQNQEKNRTNLIKKVITSTPEEDLKIIKGSLKQFQDEIKNSVPIPDHSFSAFMVFKKKGNLFRVDSQDFMEGVCSPLYKIESLKRISSADLQKMIVAHSFDTRTLDVSRFGDKAVSEMLISKSSVLLNPIPDHYKGIHKLIGFYPIVSKDEVIGFLVGFKNNIDKIFPQEEVIISALAANFAVMFTIMTGKEVQEEKNRLDGEMNIARQIQTSIVPSEITIPGYTTAAAMVTASEVGGDLYDFLPTNNGNFLDIADVAGHGLPAGVTALIHMASAHSALATADFLKSDLPIWALYDIINRVLCTINKKRIGSDKFMTCNVLREKDGKFVHAGTHLIGMLFRSNKKEVELLNDMVDKTAFQGISEYVESKGSESSFVMHSGDVLLLYTDGAIEAKNQYDEQFGMARLSHLLLQGHDEEPKELIRKIMEGVSGFAEGGDFKKYAGQFADDISLVVLKKD